MKKTITQNKVFIPLIILGFFVVICLVEALSWYISIPTAPKEFPKGNIVFQELAWGDQTYSIGFVNDDGSGVEHVHMPVNNFFGRGGMTPIYPIVSQDGTTMVFEIYRSVVSRKVIILHPGKKPIKCNPTFGPFPPQFVNNDAHILIEPFYGLYGELVIYDLANCKQSEEGGYVAVYNEETLGLPVHQGSLSPDEKELAASTILNENEPYSIVVIDLTTKEYQFIDVGVNPSFSPDGEWVAYTGVDGIYIARKDGSESRLLIYTEYAAFNGGSHFWPPKPMWSPDGNWLVYHKCGIEEPDGDCLELEDFVIFKVNVHTSEEVKIIEGGLNPYWRP